MTKNVLKLLQLKRPGRFYLFRWCLAMLFLMMLRIDSAQAQVQTEILRDGTVGNPDLSLQPQGVDGVYEIGEEHGLRPGDGMNLFHSFSKFNVSTEDTALFTASSPTNNVISRVTGGDVSLINGKIASNIEKANIYLLNSAGIMFGLNARLDVKGSFYASTADYLQLLEDDPDGMLTFTNEPRLATANPLAFGFLNQPVKINIDRSVLKVADGETLSLIGGNITVTGEPRGEEETELDCKTSCLRAPGGRVQFGTGTTGDKLPIDIAELANEDVSVEGAVKIGDDFRIDVSGDLGGSVLVRAGELSVANSEIIADTDGNTDGTPMAFDVKVQKTAQFSGSTIRARANSQGDGGSINVGAMTVSLDNNATFATETGSPSGGSGSGGGSGGGGSGGGNSGEGNGNSGVVINNNRNVSGDGSGGGSGGGGSGGGSGGGGQNEMEMGKGGNIRINASEMIEVLNDSSMIATSNSSGNAGQVDLTAPIIEVRSGARLGSVAENSGNGGNINIDASERFVLSETNGNPDPNRNRGPRVTASTRPFSTGKAGSISITSLTVTMDDGARISSSTSGGNDGGGVTIKASRSISISGKRLDGNGSSIRASSDCEDAECADNGLDRIGDAGRILIQTPSLTLEEGTNIVTNTNLPGVGGQIELDVQDLIMTGAVIQSTSTGSGSGDAGNISIGVRSDAELAHPTQNISLFGSKIETSAVDAGGGDISIESSGSLRLRNSSAIDASDTGGEGGNVNINAKRDVIVFDRSKILARAAISGGEGGFIGITTESFFNSSQSEVIAENEVVINSPETNIEGGLTALSTDFFNAPALFLPLCEAQIGGGPTGSFVVANRDGLKPSPEDVLVGFHDLSEKGSSGGADLQEQNPEDRSATNDEEILEKARLTGTPIYLAQVLSNEARSALNTHELERAANLIQEGLNVSLPLPNSQKKLNILIHIGKTAAELARLSESHQEQILLLAHDVLTQAISLADDFNDMHARSYALGNLGSLYTIENRFEEALHLIRLALSAAEQANAADSIYRWHWREGHLQWALGRTQEAIDAYRRAVNLLSDIRSNVQKRQRSSEFGFRLTVAPVYLDLVDALLQTSDRVTNSEDEQELLLEARSTVEQLKSAELRDYFRDECVTELEAKEIDIEHVSQNSAVIYPIQLSDRLELLISLPNGLKRFSVDVGIDDFSSEVRKFRQGLEIRGLHKYLPHAKKLYDWLIRPLESELSFSNIDTLVFVPGGSLLTVPLAALHDGEDFLISKFSLATTPGLNLTDPQPLKRENLNVLAVGLSESVQGFTSLPHVKEELDSIRSLYGGEQLLDQEFTDQMLEKIVNENQFSIVHIASHGQFKSESENTFILMFDDKLKVNRLNQLIGQFKYRDKPLELLTLSACETAAGDDRAALGLAGIAIRAGARSALGTLWLINDKASSSLITKFYHQLQGQEISKAGALQQAQLEFIKDKRYNHPYYWSPFLLINNWL